MPELRSILIAFGLLLLAAIYWWGRRDLKQPRSGAALQVPESAAAAKPATPSALSEMPAERLQPHVGPLAAAADIGEPYVEVEPLRTEPTVLPELEMPQPAAADHSDPVPAYKIIALRLVAAVPRFSGAHLRTALEAEALQFGKYQIFHRTTAPGEILFSVASMLEPGNFDLEQMFHEQYPGIALFAQLPGAADGLTVLGDLISCARRLQQTLGGVLQDDAGAPLLPARIEQLRREVRDFEAAQQRSRSDAS